MKHSFNRLAPFIQTYIYREKWDALRTVQVQAIETILDTPNHVLITSGTASGKTEAAFLPILTNIFENPPACIGVIYIGPLKALINDQFYRLQGLLEESGIPVQSWHGDIAQSKKQRFLRQAQGVLQITPESLEAMLINRQGDLKRLFHDLRFVVIDEVHALINSDRGRQVLCQLQRLSRYQSGKTRRIGLSATLGEPEHAMEWLKGETDVPVNLIHDTGSKREVFLGIEHFIPDDLTKSPEEQTNHAGISDEAIDTSQIYLHMFNIIQSTRKTLIFANRRNDTEKIISSLRSIAEKSKGDEIEYYVHHGNISTVLREQAETDMRDPDKPVCIAATITLELGIDIGNLDQVIQFGATSSVSSFVQRLGRSGRRGGAAKMFFYTQQDAVLPTSSIEERIPWELIQTIAIIQLYGEEKWIEPPGKTRFPFSLLYHQTMSTLVAHTEMSPSDLAERVLTLTPFAHITREQYRVLLLHLLSIGHLERVESGGLIIGLDGERIVNNYRFYATFQDEKAYQVWEESRQIGTIQILPNVGDQFILAGHSWQVVSIENKQSVVQVQRVKGRSKILGWPGFAIPIHTRIIQRMRQVLLEDNEYGYLRPGAIEQLQATRQLAREGGLTEHSILELGRDYCVLLPWQGTRVIQTMTYLLNYLGVLYTYDPYAPYYIEVKGQTEELRKSLQRVVQSPPPRESLIQGLPQRKLEINKYDRYVPDELLFTAFMEDQLDYEGMVAALQAILTNPV